MASLLDVTSNLRCIRNWHKALLFFPPSPIAPSSSSRLQTRCPSPALSPCSKQAFADEVPHFASAKTASQVLQVTRSNRKYWFPFIPLVLLLPKDMFPLNEAQGAPPDVPENVDISAVSSESIQALSFDAITQWHSTLTTVELSPKWSEKSFLPERHFEDYNGHIQKEENDDSYHSVRSRRPENSKGDVYFRGAGSISFTERKNSFFHHGAIGGARDRQEKDCLSFINRAEIPDWNEEPYRLNKTGVHSTFISTSSSPTASSSAPTAVSSPRKSVDVLDPHQVAYQPEVVSTPYRNHSLQMINFDKLRRLFNRLGQFKQALGQSPYLYLPVLSSPHQATSNAGQTTYEADSSWILDAPEEFLHLAILYRLSMKSKNCESR
ncbi:unnamed protein product [Protopolystoma xenopodis]|uniref:Uncharacterized protein n=1 Tax=Protopolystoma xenopodis TaxID=117903 RepID=A0A3S5C5K4_9PLAT|nr:unnamed protein product [Protopolystoma xenopodis]